MIVKLLNNTPLSIADIAICKCYGNEPHSNEDKVKARINRVANVSKHASTIEHLTYSFNIDGISRACLQELARHRIASYTVKSSRYTLQELKGEKPFYFGYNWKIDSREYYQNEAAFDNETLTRAQRYLVQTNNDYINKMNVVALENLRCSLSKGIPNDIAKYCMPEAYKTSLVMTINARSLQNFLELRSSKHALLEIQLLAKAMYDVIPNDHKFLYDYIYAGDVI